MIESASSRVEVRPNRSVYRALYSSTHTRNPIDNVNDCGPHEYA